MRIKLEPWVRETEEILNAWSDDLEADVELLLESLIRVPAEGSNMMPVWSTIPALGNKRF
jgi:hypothetical protein